MRFALYGLHRGSSVDPARLAARARRAEAVGFEGLWVGDHLALPDSAPDAAGEPRLEALVALTFLASVTTTVGLGVGVLVVPQRQPVLAAKQLASLDVLSGGRLTVGIGVGYVEEELSALGVRRQDRGAMTDEHVAAMRALWEQSRSPFEGRFVSFADVRQSPPPVQRSGPRPGPPIVVGGHVPAAFRRAATLGDGWFGWDLDVEATVAAIASLRAACEAVGRDPAELEVTIAPPVFRGSPVTADEAARYVAAGVHRLVVQPATFTGTEIDDLIEHVRSELLGPTTAP